MAAHFITLEGGEGTGKSTQVEQLVRRFRSQRIDAVATREPGGSVGAEQIRQLLVEGDPDRWDGRTETLLLFAGRLNHIERTIKPALASGRWVISDRFTDSTYVYQGVGRGVDRETIRRIESVSIGDFKPDLTLVLDLPVEIGLARARARQTSENRFEGFDIEFHERLRAAFRDLANRHAERCILLDATGNEDEIAKSIWRAVCHRFSL